MSSHSSVSSGEDCFIDAFGINVHAHRIPGSASPAAFQPTPDMLSTYRRSGPKSRSGCITCKIRRIKCDEAKPSCQKCLLTGRKCDGYVPPKPRKKKSKARPSSQQLMSYKALDRGLAVTWNPTTSIEGTYNQRRGFHYFLTNNFSEMAGNFESDFWNKVILQYGHQFPTVQHSLLALSATYEERTSKGLMRSAVNSKYVLQQYTKAVRTLGEYISSSDQDPRATLIACLLLVWVELLRRNIDQGFQHLFSGFKILAHLRSAGVITGCEDVYSSLGRSFRRLRIQLSIHGSTTDEIARTCPHTMDNVLKMPHTFSNIDQSRDVLDAEFKAVFGYYRRIRDVVEFGDFELVDLQSDAAIRQAYILRLEQWERATRRMAMNNPDLARSAEYVYMQLYHLTVLVLLKIPVADEMAYDSYTAEFEQIVMLAERMTGLYVKHPLMFEMGVIPPLFFVSIKCRLLRVRRKAMEIIRQAPEQEGLWIRNDTLNFCEWKINIEEAGRGDVPETEPLPLSARITHEHLSNHAIDLDTFVPFERGTGLKSYVRYRKADLSTGFLAMELTDDMKYMEWMANMLARRAPRACQSCRLHLLTLFENGFASTATKGSSRARYTTSIQSRTQAPASRRLPSSTRSFTQSKRLADLPEQPNADPAPVATAAEIETIVREARQTFGETLPKDYLSAKEYVIYERLYGPPLRETVYSDLEYLPGGEDEIQESEVRNVLLRQNAQGEYEEVEIDPSIDLSHEITLLAAENVVRQEGEEGEEFLDELAEEELAAEGEEGAESLANEILEDEQDMEEEAWLDEEVEAQQSGEDSMGAEETQPTRNIRGRNQREIEAIARLHDEMQAAAAKDIIEEEPEEDVNEEAYEEEVIEEEEDMEEIDEDDGLDSDTIRTHPHTMTARSGTNPSTINLNKHYFVAPITELLERADIKHTTEAAEKAFGGKRLPFSTSTPDALKHLPQKPIGLDASQHRMTDVEADAYMAAVMPGTYACASSTIVEVRKRLGTNWLRRLLMRTGVGPRIMDAGGGGAAAVAWREIAQAEWDLMTEEGLVKGDLPLGKTTVLTGSDRLRHRISRFLEDTTFLPRLPDYVHSSLATQHLDGGTPQPRKVYDLIIAPHSLLHLKEDYRRKNVVQNLWSLLDPKGGVLILIEKGLPRGFEAIAGARQLLLETHISSPGDTTTENEIESPASDIVRFADKEEGMIIAPCTNHNKCPMYLTPGISFGRKDYCHFSQRFIRPPFLQKVLGVQARNHEDVKFSYVAIRRGIDLRNHKKSLLQGDVATDQAFEGWEETDLPDTESHKSDPSELKFHSLSLPRAILPPLKRRGHVTLDLCTPSGKLERWTVPKSFSKTAYRDARKSKWGDLWALGAKTRTLRSPRLGRAAEASGKGGKLKGVRDGRQGKGGKKVKVNKFDIIMGEDGFEGIEEDRSRTKFVKREKRTKGGRIYKPRKPIGEDDL
ncbi:Zn2/Cys6 DNA-binding protein [Glarea lozoyensis ATCC 20868]|uniref:Zn2/Cys6 DNA-binding protein n=1 Tax=Glarea lozoyensis (strain ATCC 20868 / MF5171) TaxID=1116229 RepID=S3D0J0_GLAL2|nr:Zn2/Cys6 DNA-binding protein [Glarea lozoyensis ATCC 20868]EPE32052.1 Zn2/Cys6 DNA-binding protein [Glarea lozoyensis ATCC 20868]